jgi:hypothetical protein
MVLSTFLKKIHSCVLDTPSEDCVTPEDVLEYLKYLSEVVEKLDLHDPKEEQLLRKINCCVGRLIVLIDDTLKTK